MEIKKIYTFLNFTSTAINFQVETKCHTFRQITTFYNDFDDVINTVTNNRF